MANKQEADFFLRRILCRKWKKLAGEMGWVQVTEPKESPITEHDTHETPRLLPFRVNTGPEWQTNKFLFSLVNRGACRGLRRRE